MKKILFQTVIFTVSIVLVELTAVTGCTKKSLYERNGIVVTENLQNKPVLVGNIPCQFPLAKENESLNIIIAGHNDIQAEDVFVWKKYQEMTGVAVNWTTIKKSARREAVYMALMNKTPIDLIMRCKIASDSITKYGENGLILDLVKDDMLHKYAPNCWAYLQTHPEALASVRNPNGAIYSLPQINSGAELRVSRKLFINKKWLSAVHKELPKTTKDLYILLKAFKEQDANGNGDTNDEIPFCSPDWQSIQEAFYGSFGLANRGVHNLLIDCDEKTGKVRFIPSSDNYKEFLMYFSRLYTEGLLDKHTFTMTTGQWATNTLNDRIGVFASTNLASVPAEVADNWIAVEEPLEGPSGYKFCSAIRANFHSAGAAIIPATCKNPALVLRWLDYFWTDEGTLFYHMGIENETFVVKEDGTYDYAPRIYEEIKAKGKSFDDIVALYSPYPGGSNPTVEVAPYFMGGEMSKIIAAAAKKLFEYGSAEYWPSFTFTMEESDHLGFYQSDIVKYNQEALIDFVTGAKSFSFWDKYVLQLKKLGSDEVLAVYQTAADRYNALKKNPEFAAAQ